MPHALGRIGWFLLTAALVGCAHSPPDDPQDPLQPVNRGIYQFNDTADRYVLRPVAKTYVDVTPDPIEHGIGNFVDNLKYPITIINDYLQFKFHDGSADLARFIINTGFGFLGFVDVASGLGLAHHDEDFGQTLGYWGLGQGVYLMLPILGPSTGRDVSGRVTDGFIDPMNNIGDTATLLSLQALYLLDLRASFLGFDRTVRNAFDPYLFIRGAYLQRRQSAVYDGNPPHEELDGDHEYD